MNGAGLRKTALLAALAAAAACCLGSGDGVAGATATQHVASAGGPAGSEQGPAAQAGPITSAQPVAKPTATGAATAREAVPVAATARPPVNGSSLPTSRVTGTVAGSTSGAATKAAAAGQTYTNPWRYCPGDIQLGVSDGEGCDEWWLAGSYVDSGVTHYGMNAVNAWQTTMGQGVTIGLLSSGADTNDPDYADNVAPGGYNFVDGNTDTNDTYGTGTVLTGVMAAEANNGGFVGVAPKAKVLQVKVLGPYGNLTDAAASQGITWAASHGASVIAFPLYEIGPGSSYLPQTQIALNATANENIVVALASGDLGSTTQGVQNGPPNDLISPDGSQLPNTITVASEDYLNNFDQFTDSGAGVQIAAPGTSLLGDYPDNWPSGGWTSGSQSAASEVAAVAALLRSAYPSASATQVVQAILSGGRPLPSLQGMVSCGCMLDASGAMAALGQLLNVAPVVYAPPATQSTPTTPTYDNGSGAFWGDCSVPTGLTDPRGGCEWYVPNTYNETGYYGGTHTGVNLAAVWPQDTGVGTEVATVDTGAAPNPDFASQLVTGWNFWDGNNNTTDVVYHGTYTASLIAAQPNNGLGIAGVAPGATLMPVKVLGPNEEWVNSNIVSGINYAADTPGVRAVNISLAGLNSPVPGIQGAMQNAEQNNVLLVFAAGNWGADHDNPQYVPSFDGTGFNNVLTVAATTHWNTIAFFSDYGPGHVDIAAPGEGIAMDTIDGSDGATSYGTSFAAPLVTGVAALLFSAYPTATAAQVKEAICNGATPLPQLMTKVRCGLLNAEGALQALAAILDGPPVPAAPTNNVAPTTDAGTTLTVGQTVDATAGTWTSSPTSYSYQWQVSPDGTSGWSNASGSGAGTSSYTVAAADVGNHLRVTVTATNAGGSANASSGATNAVVPPAPAGGVPTIAGSAKVGQVLTASPGTWSNSPTSYGYQWQRSTNGTSWANASGAGATTSGYTVASADAGGSLRVTVTATNAGGSASASSAATATVPTPDTTPPTVSITAPRSGSSVSTTTTLTATASDNVGVTKVEFYVDGTLVATDTASPYTASWNPATVALGTHSLTAKAYDLAGNSKTSAAVSVKVTDTTAPTVSVTSPANGSSVTHSTTVTITGSAADNRAVSKVQFYVNNVLKCTDTATSYTCSWSVPSSKGVRYTVTVRAYDSSNNTAAASVTVTSK